MFILFSGPKIPWYYRIMAVQPNLKSSHAILQRTNQPFHQRHLTEGWDILLYPVITACTDLIKGCLIILLYKAPIVHFEISRNEKLLLHVYLFFHHMKVGHMTSFIRSMGYVTELPGLFSIAYQENYFVKNPLRTFQLGTVANYCPLRQPVTRLLHIWLVLCPIGFIF